MTIEYDVDVCIVGGGPAGMVLANLVAGHGLRTLVLEKSPDFEREFRGEVLQPRFMRTMEQIGLAEFILAQPHERFDLARIYDRGEVIGEFGFDAVDAQHPFVMWMTQPVMLRALHERARHYPSYDLWFSAKVHALIRDADAVVGVRVSRGDEEVSVRARVVVAADGRFSTIARLADIETVYEHYPFDVLWFNIDRPADAVNQISGYVSDEASYISVPKYPNLFQIGMLMTLGRLRRFRERGIDALRGEIARAHPWFVPFADGLEDFSAFSVLQAKLARRRPWARDGLLLIGDAAHTCSPVGAIGISVAVETAVVAADVILSAPQEQVLTGDLLRQVEQRRSAEIGRVHRIQRFAGNAIARTNRVWRALRRVAIRVGSMTGLTARSSSALLTRNRPLPVRPDLRALPVA